MVQITSIDILVVVLLSCCLIDVCAADEVALVINEKKMDEATKTIHELGKKMFKMGKTGAARILQNLRTDIFQYVVDNNAKELTIYIDNETPKKIENLLNKGVVHLLMNIVGDKLTLVNPTTYEAECVYPKACQVDKTNCDG